MFDPTHMRSTVDQARRRQDEIAEDRLDGGRLGDSELTKILVTAYPSLSGQLN